MKKIKKYDRAKSLVLLLFAICLAPAWVAAETSSFIDHFDSPELKSIWDIKARNGGYFINDWMSSRLMLVSSQVEEGVYLNYAREIIDRYVAFEVKLDTSHLTDGIYVGFADQIMIPGDNEEVNTHNLGGVSIVRSGWWARMEDGLKEGRFQKGWHIFSVKIDGKFIKVYIDGVYIGSKRRTSGPIYFCVSADAYTNYYTAKVTIDYIKISYGK